MTVIVHCLVHCLVLLQAPSNKQGSFATGMASYLCKGQIFPEKIICSKYKNIHTNMHFFCYCFFFLQTFDHRTKL